MLRYLTPLGIGLLLLHAPWTMAQQSDDAYLKAIQAESNKVEDLSAAQKEEKQLDTSIRGTQGGASYLQEIEQEAARLANAKPADQPAATGPDSQTTMEQMLASSYPASYKLYQAMNETDKRKVGDTYVKLADRDEIYRNSVVVKEIILLSINE